MTPDSDSDESSSDIVASCLSFKPSKKFKKSDTRPGPQPKPRTDRMTDDLCVSSADAQPGASSAPSTSSASTSLVVDYERAAAAIEPDPVDSDPYGFLRRYEDCLQQQAEANDVDIVDPLENDLLFAKDCQFDCSTGVSAPERIIRTNMDPGDKVEMKPSVGVSYRLLSRVQYPTESRLLCACHDLLCRPLGDVWFMSETKTQAFRYSCQ
jgi:hypothetical protein